MHALLNAPPLPTRNQALLLLLRPTQIGAERVFLASDRCNLRSFHGEVHRTLAERACPVFHAPWHGKSIARVQLDPSIFELKQKSAFYSYKDFVRVGMRVPEVRFGHQRQAQYVIVAFGYDYIFVSSGKFRQPSRYVHWF